MASGAKRPASSSSAPDLGASRGTCARRTDIEIMMIDRTNHHVFQPLLYQTRPRRWRRPISRVRCGMLRHHRNTTVIMGEVTGVDPVRHGHRRGDR